LLEDSFQLACSAVVNGSRALMALEERFPAGLAKPPWPEQSIQAGALSLLARLALLFGVRMVRGTGVQALADLAALSEELTFEPGEPVFRRGVPRGDFLLVVEGEVLAEREGPRLERRYGPGELVSAIATLAGVADAWPARAVTPVRGISFPIDALFDLMEEHFDLVRSTVAAIGARREELLEHLALEAGDLTLT
jgi:hypothetical protein